MPSAPSRRNRLNQGSVGNLIWITVLREQICFTDVLPRPAEFHGVCALIAVQAFASLSFSSSRTRGLQARLGPFADERPFGFRKCSEDVEDQLPWRGTGVNRFLQAFKPTFPLTTRLERPLGGGSADARSWPARPAELLVLSCIRKMVRYLSQ